MVRKFWRTFDWSLYLLPTILIAIGISVIYTITYFSAKTSLATDQIIYAGVGMGLMVVFTFLDYRTLRGLAPFLYLLSFLLLVIVAIFGRPILGAARWIVIGPVQIQPSEIFKLILIIFLARFFQDRIGKVKWQQLVLIFLAVVIPFLLIVRQPDIGTGLIILVIVLVVILSIQLTSWQKIILTILAGLIILMGFLAVKNIKPFGLLLKQYQRSRIITFFNPDLDPYGAGYNVKQSLIAIGSGGLWGQGLGKGSQSQLNFLPVAHTDFIFAGLAEATGFIGSAVLLVIFVILLWRIINVAIVSKDNFGMLFSLGVAGMILGQLVINVGMNLGILPITGIPLPFVSHGGTSLVINLIAIGILQSIYLRHKKITF
jgi:rod shape determining protein RodA